MDAISTILPCNSVKLKAFTKFENTTDALSAVTALVEGKLSKNLKEFLSESISEKEMKKESLIVGDSKLGKNWLMVHHNSSIRFNEQVLVLISVFQIFVPSFNRWCHR